MSGPGLRVFAAGEHPDRDTFERDFLRGSMPALFRTEADDSGAAWSPAALAARFSSRLVPVRESRSEEFAIDPATGAPPAARQMPFGELVAALGQAGRHVYLMQQPIAKVFPELVGELPLPAYVRVEELQSLNLWIGQAGNVTRLHWDNYNNFLVQLSGRKRILLLPPDARGLSTPGDAPSRAPHQVDLKSPIRVRDASGAGIRCVLNPGEYLFIPAFWWHEVESLDAAVSVNAWWKASFEQCFVDTALAALRRTPPEPDYVLFYLKTVRWERSLWEAAELARDKGVEWLCRRLLAAAVDADLKAVCRRRGVAAAAPGGGWSAQQIEGLAGTLTLPEGAADDLALLFAPGDKAGAAAGPAVDLAELFTRARTLSARLAVA